MKLVYIIGTPVVLVWLGCITKYYNLGGLYNRNLFFKALENENSKFKVSVDLVLGENSFHDF